MNKDDQIKGMSQLNRGSVGFQEALAKQEQGDHFDCGTYVGSHIGKEIRHSIGDDLPAQKPWVGLTDEEIAEVEDEYIVDYRIPAGSAWNFAKDIEAKLKEKNT